MSKINKMFHSERYEVSYYVRPEHDEWRLDRFMQSYLGTLSREFIKKKIAKHEIYVEGRVFLHRPSTRVKHGQTITMVTFPHHEEEKEKWRGEEIDVYQEPTVLFEDEGLLVISKPPFMTTHPTGRRLFYCATVFYETRYGHTIHSIHRLDRETSGVLLLGKNPKASQFYSSLFELNEVRKVYFLVAHQNRVSGEDKDSEIGKTGLDLLDYKANERLSKGDSYSESMGDETRLFIKAYEESSIEGRDAETSFQCLWANDHLPYVLFLAYPKTGRQHQIRVHSSIHDYPLVGDKLYPNPKIFTRFKDGVSTEEDFDHLQIPRHALHAYALKVKEQFFKSPLPVDLVEWMKERLGFDELKIAELEAQAEGLMQGYFSHADKVYNAGNADKKL